MQNISNRRCFIKQSNSTSALRRIQHTSLHPGKMYNIFTQKPPFSCTVNVNVYLQKCNNSAAFGSAYRAKLGMKGERSPEAYFEDPLESELVCAPNKDAVQVGFRQPSVIFFSLQNDCTQTLITPEFFFFTDIRSNAEKIQNVCFSALKSRVTFRRVT